MLFRIVHTVMSFVLHKDFLILDVADTVQKLSWLKQEEACLPRFLSCLHRLCELIMRMLMQNYWIIPFGITALF